MSTTSSLFSVRSKNLLLIKEELIAAWAYLATYVELFDHPDPKRMDLLLESAPGFFALVQGALLEGVLVRLARLMDPEATGKLKNVSFDGLLADSSLHAVKLFDALKSDWKTGQYQLLRKYRHKVLAHNDFATMNGASAQVSTKLEPQDVTKLRELFVRLWAVLADAHREINNTAILEPSFSSLDMQPTRIFRELKWAVYQSRLFDAALEAGRPEELNCQGFEFAGVGEEKPLRLIGNDLPD